MDTNPQVIADSKITVDPSGRYLAAL